MYRVVKVKLLEAVSEMNLDSVINDYLEKNSNEIVIDIKYTVYETDLDEVFREENKPTREIRYSALLLIGGEI